MRRSERTTQNRVIALFTDPARPDCLGYVPQDLSADALTTFRTLAKKSRRVDGSLLSEPDVALLEKLNLLEGAYLKRAALLLFHPDPEKFVTGAYVKIGYFRSETDLLYHDEIHGDLFSQTQKTMDLLLTKYLKAAISYSGLHRQETLPVPEAALREALLNAIIHRDYAVGSPIQIRVYPDRIMIWNPGELPEQWTVAKLLETHASHPFNPCVANTFFRAGEIEAWGRGVQRIMEACREAGAPVPLIDFQGRDLWVEFPYSANYMGIVPAEKKTSPAARGKTSVETGEKTGEKTREKTREKTGEKILRLLREQPSSTTAEIAEYLGLSRKGVEWQLRKLKLSDRIIRIGPDKGGNWQVLP